MAVGKAERVDIAVVHRKQIHIPEGAGTAHGHARFKIPGVITAGIRLLDKHHAIGGAPDVGNLGIGGTGAAAGHVFRDRITVVGPVHGIAAAQVQIEPDIAGTMIDAGVGRVLMQQIVGVQIGLHIGERHRLVVPGTRGAAVQKPVTAGILEVGRRGGGDEFFGVVGGVHGERQTQLLLIAQAGGLGRLQLGFGQGGQQHGGQNRDDGNDHQQFDQRERPANGGAANGRNGINTGLI